MESVCVCYSIQVNGLQGWEIYEIFTIYIWNFLALELFEMVCLIHPLSYFKLSLSQSLQIVSVCIYVYIYIILFFCLFFLLISCSPSWQVWYIYMCVSVCVRLEGLWRDDWGSAESYSTALLRTCVSAELSSQHNSCETRRRFRAHHWGEKVLAGENDKLRELKSMAEKGEIYTVEENWERRAEKDEHHIQ